MQIQKIKIKVDYQLADVIHDIEKGILRIPQFQREFIWDKPKVIRLLESIYKEYPIGSFFFWDAPRKYYGFYRDIAELNLPKPDKWDKISFILDGQQRLTSLYVTVKGLTLFNQNYRNICFDLDEKKFTDHNPDNNRYVSLSDILSESRYSDIYRELDKQKQDALYHCLQNFINYPFSAIEVHEKELDEVCDIFERINQGGQRLNLFDLISASTWTEDFDLRFAVKEENKELLNKGFGEIGNETFVQSLALIARGSCTRIIQLQLRDEDIKKYWSNTLVSLRQAIDYCRNNFGVINSNFIPYPSMIAIIAYIFSKQGNKSFNPTQAEQLSQWFWQTTFSERYGASTLTLMTEDKKLMDKIADGKEVTIKFPLNLDMTALMKIRMNRKSAIKHGVLCLLVKKNPLHFLNNNPLNLSEGYFSEFNTYEKHHIFPKSFIQKKYHLEEIHALPNFCFLPLELNREITNQKPSKYFAKYFSENADFEDTLKTHLIKYDDSIKKDDYQSFLASRAIVILEEINRITGSKVSRVIQDDVNKAIDKIEKEIRDLIDRTLIAKDKDYWKKLIPSDIVGEVRKRVNQDLARNPTKTINDYTSREFLDYCDIMDYPKIILLDWDYFYSIFRSKYDTQNWFLSLNEYRKSIKHNRESIPSFIQLAGKGALEWLSAIIEKQRDKGKTIGITLTDEEIVDRAESGFVKKMVKDFPKWVEASYSKDGIVKLKGGTGSDHYIKLKGQTIVWYYFAKNWVYVELRNTSKEEIEKLLRGLTDPKSILKKAHGKVRFHLLNDKDFSIFREIIRSKS